MCPLRWPGRSDRLRASHALHQGRSDVQLPALPACPGLCRGGRRGVGGYPPGPQILTTDASRFYALYDSTGGKPSVAQLAGYLAEGSPGLSELAKARRVTPERMAEAIASQPGVYAQGRSYLAELPAVKQRLVQVFGNLQAIYPQSAFPPVTSRSVVVSRSG